VDEHEFFEWRTTLKDCFPSIATEPDDGNEKIFFIDLQLLKDYVNDMFYRRIVFNFVDGYNWLKEAFKFSKATYRFLPDKDMKQSKRNDLKDINSAKLHYFIGNIIMVTPVLAKLVKIHYICMLCNTITTIKQDNPKLEKKPRRCKNALCKSAYFEKSGQVIVNYQIVEFIEESELLKENENPEIISCEFELTQLPNDYISNSLVGSKVKIFGTLQYTLDKKVYIKGNNLIPFEEINLTENDIQKIERVISDPNYIWKLTKQICHKIQGYDFVKYLLFLPFVSLYREEEEANLIHILLISDMGKGKTKITKLFIPFMPKIKFINATATTYVGLTASLEQNMLTKTWEIRAGAIKICDNGVLLLDEIDKADKDSMKALHTPLSDGLITITKTKGAEWKVNTNIIASANPHDLKFDPNIPVFSQLGLGYTILDRFCLWVILKPDVADNDNIIKKIIQTHSGIKNIDINREFEPEFVKKLVFYLHRLPLPLINEKIQEYIYIKIKEILQIYDTHFENNPRFPANFVKICRVHAKAFGRLEVEKYDVDMALLLFQECMFKPLYNAFGKVDMLNFMNVIDIATITKFPKSKGEKIKYLEEKISLFSNRKITWDEILKMATDVKISEYEMNEIIELFKREGFLSEPRANSGFFEILR
jgi:DNA replicative helicase MCM subunit Mcm2 (Cdc46/Mcm family)